MIERRCGRQIPLNVRRSRHQCSTALPAPILLTHSRLPTPVIPYHHHHTEMPCVIMGDSPRTQRPVPMGLVVSCYHAVKPSQSPARTRCGSLPSHSYGVRTSRMQCLGYLKPEDSLSRPPNDAVTCLTRPRQNRLARDKRRSLASQGQMAHARAKG